MTRRNTSPGVLLTQYELIEDETTMPMLTAPIPAGEPLSLSNEIEMVNLHKLLTEGVPDPMLFRVHGLSMAGEVDDGDWVIASRSNEPFPGDIVVASINGEQTIKVFEDGDRDTERRRLYLVPRNEDFPKRELTIGDDVQILAVVARVIRHLKGARRVGA